MEWMAWTWPTAIFFIIIASLITLMTLLAIYKPEMPRVGIFKVETTRGDRLFMSLLGSAFIALLWLAQFGTPVWGGLVICALYTFVIFKWA